MNDFKKKEQFTQYLKECGYSVNDSGRISECPICSGKDTAQIYEGGLIHCFRESCVIDGKMDINSFRKIFNNKDTKPMDIKNFKAKSEEAIVVDIDKNELIFNDAIEFFHSELIINDDALQALINRGRTKESIDHFKVGYLQNFHKLFKTLSHKYGEDTVVNSGLFKINDDGKSVLRLNWDGYCYPIYHKGKLRNIKSKKGKDSMYIAKKYTGEDYQIFFNSDALKEDEIYLVEGENDAMRLWELGKKNVVAILGQLSNNQIKYLKEIRKGKAYSILFDNDDTGDKYTTKLINSFKGINKHTINIISYDGKDPDIGTDFDWDGKLSSSIKEEILKSFNAGKEEDEQKLYDILDSKYIKLLVSGKVRILMKDSLFRNWMDIQNFKSFESTPYKILDRWLKNVKCYIDTCVDFENPSVSNVKLNLFTGFKVEPKETGIDIRHIYYHISSVLCSNDKVAYKYLLDWIAHMLQRPYETVGTSPVFIGEQGGGKSIIIEHLLGHIIGHDYFIATGHAADYTSQFNSMLEGKLLVNIDEASFGGNHSEAGVLKRVIGNDTIRITRKGLEGYSVANRIRMMFSSNHDQPVKIEKSNRRYFVLETSDTWVNTAKKKTPSMIKKYFTMLIDVLNSGGREQFYHEMLQRDISEFNRFSAPQTLKEKELKAEALNGVEEWFYSCIFDKTSHSFKSDIGFIQTSKIHSSTMLDLYKKYNPTDRYINQTKFSMTIAKLIGVKASNKTITYTTINGGRKQNLSSNDGRKLKGWSIDDKTLKELEKKFKEFDT